MLRVPPHEWLRTSVLVAALALFPACGGGGSGRELPLPEASLAVQSPAFDAGAPIPPEFTCEGADRSPPLHWDPGPPDTAAYAIVVDDPDAPGGIFVHWTIWNLPPSTTSLPADASRSAALPPAVREGRNDFGRPGWGGPCPPPGDKPHRYRFRVYALGSPLEFPAESPPARVLDALEGNILAWGELIGTFDR